MRHEWHVLLDRGLRFWVAWTLERLAYRIKSTTRYEVVKTQNGAFVLIRGDDWGSGIFATRGVSWETDKRAGRPLIRQFDDFDTALDWANASNDEEAA